MNNEFVKEWVQWAIDFVQMDISKLSRTDKYSFFQKFNWFAGPYLFGTSFDPFGKSIQFSQNQIIEWETIALEIQVALKEFIDQMTTTRANYGLPEITSWIRSESLWPPSSKDHHIYFQVHSVPQDLTPKNWAILNLSRLIEGREMHVIGKCKECQRYFLNFSFREKFYCISGCGSKFIARSRRERLKGDPKKWKTYQKEQRRYANWHYEEKQKVQGKKVKHRHAPTKRQKKVEVQVK
jgi:hypothetical protein